MKDLPGKPDIVFKKLKKVIFVHGCFWHRHEQCKFSTIPKTNTAFWLRKFERTVERDKEVIDGLINLGWSSFVVWECQLKKNNSISLNIMLKNFLEY